MYCYICEKKLSDEYKYCPECGSELHEVHDFKNVIEYLTKLSNGIDPSSNETFDTKQLLLDDELQKVLRKITNVRKSIAGTKIRRCENILSRPTEEIYNKLLTWEKDSRQKYGKEIFSPNQLMDIAKSDIVNYYDLYEIASLQNSKVIKYGEEIFDVIKPYINENDKETYYNLIHASVLLKCSDDNYTSENKSGERWTEEDELILMNLMDTREGIEKFVKKLGRSETGIIARLVHLGYFDKRDDAREYFGIL